ncbi:MAG TPA: TonB-dependent receptor, partial [Pyrinomonadaceae bacterium]|nr:TonB-dependent receptor [Pyrinomonadaceae bacterium]
MSGHRSLKAILVLLFCAVTAAAFGQSAGTATLRGTVILGDDGQPVHNALITVLQLRRTAETDEAGRYEIANLPPGTYDVSAHLDRVPDTVEKVVVPASGEVTADFTIRLSAVREQVTVTATGTETATSNSIQSVSVLGSTDIAKKNPVSLGEALDHELGVAKRSFGPGTARPVIRGFDADRVLVLQDGMRVGSLGSQSGDHGEPIDVLSVERIEVVKGPATLLYGSNAIGGVVNTISGHESPHKGASGYVTTVGSTNRNQAGASAGVEFGTDRWLFWGNGGGQRSGDYNTPIGRVQNSFTRDGNASAGFGYYPTKGFFSFNYAFDKKRYGIPYDPAEEDPEIVYLTPRRHGLQFNGGFRDLNSFVEGARFGVQYNDYQHSEVEKLTNEVGTSFKNKTFLYRGMFDQRKEGRLTGSFGFWGQHRDYASFGEEAIAPPTIQNAFALYTLQTLNFEHLALQFGGRLEANRYRPSETEARGVLPQRNFTGFSGAVGVRVPIWDGGSFVANYTRSYRAPALEELYNLGPHPGNLAFEIGDANLKRELSNGIDGGVRHTSARVHAEANVFYYHIDDFIFLAPTEEEEDGLIVAEYKQGTTRYAGTEARLDVALHPQYLWLNLGADYVNAKLTATDTPLPRIPPLRGRAGLEFRYKGLIVNPEAILSSDQNKIFPTETRTAGYGVFNLSGSYTFASRHAAHII